MNTLLPAHEVDGFAALSRSHTLNTTPEAAFDDLARLAAYICGAATAVISLDGAGFSTQGMLQSDIVVVPDTQTDARFADSPMVAADPHIRFYAGVPLTTPDGQPLGMLWVKDQAPRQLSPEQVEALRALGRQASAQMALRRHVAELERIVVDHQRAEEKLRQDIHEETIRAQAAALAELSTPLIPISDQVMVMPRVGTVDSRRAQQVVETLLHGIAESKAQVAILDITGVPIVDTQVANALVRAAQAVRLLGAQVVLTGIRPEVAQTLVGLGVDLSNIITHSSLQSGIAFAMQQR